MTLTTPRLVDLASDARDALLDKLSSEIYDGERVSAKTRRYNKTLDALAAVLDVDRKGAEAWLLRNVK